MKREDLKRTLQGKTCSTCRNQFDNECIIQAIPVALPKDRTCEKWQGDILRTSWTATMASTYPGFEINKLPDINLKTFFS